MEIKFKSLMIEQFDLHSLSDRDVSTARSLGLLEHTVDPQLHWQRHTASRKHLLRN